MIYYDRVLLVEDDPDDVFLFTEAIRRIKNDIKIVVARNGIHALEVLAQNKLRPQLIFSDINMPAMSGFELLYLLKKNPELRSIPVVMLTTAQAEMDECFSMGAHAFLVKPLTMNLLTSILITVLETDFALKSRMEFVLR